MINGRALLASFLLLAAFGGALIAQRQTPPREEQEPITVLTEEVLVPIVAYNELGRPDPTLEPDDILLLEDGVPQQVRSVRRLPASVLLVLDTGGEVNPAKTLQTTRHVAIDLIEQLRPDDQIAIMQVNDDVRIIQDWTTDKKAAARAIIERLFSGRRTFLSDALAKAATYLTESPNANRHAVLISDGAETGKSQISYEEAARRLTQTGATVHLISYIRFSQKALERESGVVRPRTRSSVPEEVIRELPPQSQPIYRTPGGITIDLDRKRRKLIEDYEEAMRSGTERLRGLVERTGGLALFPDSTAKLKTQTERVARDIAAQYLITYTPRRALASAPAGEVRHIEIAPRRIGLQLKARRSFVTIAKNAVAR